MNFFIQMEDLEERTRPTFFTEHVCATDSNLSKLYRLLTSAFQEAEFLRAVNKLCVCVPNLITNINVTDGMNNIAFETTPIWHILTRPTYHQQY